MYTATMPLQKRQVPHPATIGLGAPLVTDPKNVSRVRTAKLRSPVVESLLRSELAVALCGRTGTALIGPGE